MIDSLLLIFFYIFFFYFLTTNFLILMLVCIKYLGDFNALHLIFYEFDTDFYIGTFDDAFLKFWMVDDIWWEIKLKYNINNNN